MPASKTIVSVRCDSCYPDVCSVVEGENITKTETIINDIYDAWRAQDLDWLASYLPDDFSHMIYIPAEVHPLGGLCNGKADALRRLGLITAQFDCLHFDTSDLMIRKDRAGLEIPFRYRHRETGMRLETKMGEICGPSRMAGRSGFPNTTMSAAFRPSAQASLR